MVRAMKSFSTLMIGLMVAGQALALRAAEPGTKPQPSSDTLAADYVVELPADEESTDALEEESAESTPALEPAEDAAELAPPTEEDQTSAPDEEAMSEEPAPSDSAPKEETEVIKERFPNGAIRIEREVTQDAQGNYLNHGPWKMWDEKGNVVAQGQYEYGNRTGVWIRWYRSVTEAPLLSKPPYQQFPGPFISQATFKNDQLDGAWTIYDGKMHKISQWTFEGGKRQGPSTWWYVNGKKMREANFKAGDMDGTYLEWAPDGALRLKETFESGRKLASKTTNYQGGAKKSEGMYLFAKDVEHTPDDYWNLKLVTTTKSGKDEKHGPWASWYQSGQRQLEGHYEHDMQVGLFTWWHANGQRALEGRFDNGKQTGTWTWWHANGQKSIQGDYAGGNPSGRWTWWKEDGRVVQSADLSHSEGVVMETPRTLDQPPAGPRLSKPAQRLPVKR